MLSQIQKLIINADWSQVDTTLFEILMLDKEISNGFINAGQQEQFLAEIVLRWFSSLEPKNEIHEVYQYSTLMEFLIRLPNHLQLRENLGLVKTIS